MENSKIERDIEREEQKNKWNRVHTRLSTQFKDTAEKILNALKAVQFTPSHECIEPNDSLIKKIFALDDAAFSKALRGKKFAVKGKSKTQKKPAVFSKATISNVLGYENESPLDEFDRAVLGVIISECLFGNTVMTTNTIYRALIGKVGQADAGIYPKKNQEAAIINSILKLMSKLVNLKYLAETMKELKYTDKDGNEFVFEWTLLLPVSVGYAKVNGQESSVIFFKGNSPLFDIADAKNQVIRYPHELLNVPNQNNTPLVISLKKYVMRRICEIKLHKQLKPTITFEDVFTKCRVDNTTNREIIRRYREYILRFFEHLKEQNFITNFEVVKRGNSINQI